MAPIPLHHVWQYTEVDRAFWQEHLEGWLPEHIFDAHTHVNEPQFRLTEMTEEMRRQYWVNEVSEPIGAADADRCHRIVFPGRRVSCVAFGLPLLDYDLDASNASLQRECVQRDWYRLAVVRPQWSVEKVSRELDLPRTLGVKVYYSLISHDPTTRDKHLEASIFEFLPRAQLELMDRRGAWVTLHVPRAGRLPDPRNVAEIRQIRREFPRVVLVLAHLGRCYTLPHAQAAFPLLADDEGLYLDISAVLHPEVLALAIRTFGPKRILFGTDNPVFYMRGRQEWRGDQYIYHTNYPFHFNRDRDPPEVEARYTLAVYEALRALREACTACGLARADVEAILHGNARSLAERVRGSIELTQT